MMDEELPKGWALAQLADVTLPVPNVKPDAEPEKIFGYVDISSIDNSSFSITEVRMLRGKDAPSRARRPVKSDDTLFSNVRTYLRNIALVPEGLRVGVCSTGFTVLRPNSAVDPRYLFRYVLTDAFIDSVTPLQTGTHYPATSDRVVMSERIPLAPFAEQGRIVAKLEELLGRVNASQKRLELIPAILKRFRQSVLAAACSGNLTADWRENAAPQELIPPEPVNPDDIVEVEDIIDAPAPWRRLPLQAVCDPDRTICYGVIKLGAEVSNGIPCLRTSDVRPLAIDLTRVKRIAPAISDEYRRTLLRGGEVLVNVRGTLGGVAVVPNSLCGWNISREVAVVPVKGVVPTFIALWIASLPCQNWLTGVAKGVAYTGVNIADLKLLPVALPPLHEQHEIVRRVEALFKIADRLGLRYKEAKQRVDSLTQSILAKAFRGELVPQDPKDEPASALLARLAAQSGGRDSQH
jgi:type I restriction enzyme S subunit